MEFSNTASCQGIVQDIDFLCGTNTTTYPLVDKVRNINQAYRDVNRLIWDVCDQWQYDDANNTDTPKALTTLTGGTKTYAIPTTSQKIRRIEVKNANGDWVKLEPIDYKDINEALPEFLETAGLPIYYDLVGQFISLYPTPAADKVTTSSGMAVYMDRDVVSFTTASTTLEPGFAPSFHRILSLQAALDLEQDANKRNLFVAEKTQLTEGLKRFYGSRMVEDKVEIMPRNKKYYHQYE